MEQHIFAQFKLQLIEDSSEKINKTTKFEDGNEGNSKCFLIYPILNDQIQFCIGKNG